MQANLDSRLVAASHSSKGRNLNYYISGIHSQVSDPWCPIFEVFGLLLHRYWAQEVLGMSHSCDGVNLLR